MTNRQIQQLLQQKTAGELKSATCIETHISWVILTADYAFKIKKPIHYSFLDFSTLQKRKYYCERELVLNRRQTEGIYLDVVPIRQNGTHISIDGSSGTIIEYAVKMKRLDTARQMNVLLKRGEVTIAHMEILAKRIATFHTRTEIVTTPPDIIAMQEDFADILNIKDFLVQQTGRKAGVILEEAVDFSYRFLKENTLHLLARHDMGYTIDGHGDLHSKNIFLLEQAGEIQPVIFDCIEFSDHFRQIDILNELAFFCMDLDFYQREDLELPFLRSYFLHHSCVLNERDYPLFEYYKLYRANVRVKVNALKTMQAENETELKKRMDLVQRYFKLMNSYLQSSGTGNASEIFRLNAPKT